MSPQAETAIITQSVKRGKELPDRIKNAPSLLPGLELYWQGFMDLMSSRITGMGIGPIWWSEVQKYCEAKGLSADQTEAMHYHIRVMDTAYIEHSMKKAKS